MPATDDRWDVVVVGLRDPSQASAVMVIAELAHYASLPPQDIERMLDDGEVPVLGNLDRAEAERAANELSELGAVVDLRLAMDDSGVFPVFKPDAERTVGVAVGGLIDDSATPPTVGESMALPELEPDLEGASAPRARQRTRTPRPAPVKSSVLDDPNEFALGDLGGPPGLDLGLEPLPPPDPPPEPRAKKKPAAKKSSQGVDALLGDIGGAAPAAAPKSPKRPKAAGPPPGDPELGLELDFEAAGMARPPPKGGATAASAAPVDHGAERSGSNMPRRTRDGNMGGTGASAAGREQSAGSLGEALRNDGVSALLLGLGVGLLLGLVLAMAMQRGDARERLPPLEEELAAALNDPAGVQSGEHREPAAIEGEIDGALGDLQQKFLLWWLIPGAVVGVGLSRLRAL